MFQPMVSGCHGVLGANAQRLVVVAGLRVNVSVTLHKMVDNLVRVQQKMLDHVCYEHVQVSIEQELMVVAD